MIITRTKLFKGIYYDVRSYERDYCIKNKKDLLCLLNDKDGKLLGKMTLTHKELSKRRPIKEMQKNIPSKINQGQVYDILSYEWHPEKDIDWNDPKNAHKFIHNN